MMARAGVLLLVLSWGFHAAPAAAQELSWLDAWTRLQPPPRPLLDEDAPLAARVEAAQRLGRHGDAELAVSTLVAALEKASEAALRHAVLRALARRGAPEAIPALRALLEEEETREPEVLHALAAIGGEDAGAGLVYALQHEGLREAARGLLPRLGPDALASLLPALEGTQAAVAAELLGALGRPAAVAPLAEQARRASDPDLRVAALRALGRIGGPRARPLLLEALEAEDPERVAAALEGLARAGEREDVTAIVPRLDHAAPPVRAAALRALARLAPERARRALDRAMRGEGPVPRSVAVDVLLERPVPAWIAQLVGLVERGLRRAHAASALARLDTPDGLRALHDLAAKKKQTCPPLRRAFALGLRRHGDKLASHVRKTLLDRLRAEPSLRRRLWLRAVARDATVGPWLLALSSSPSPDLRAMAAFGLQLLDARDIGGVLRMQLQREGSAAAFRSQARAALALGICIPPAALLTEARQRPETTPEALELAAACAEHGSDADRLRLAKRLRQALRGHEPRHREPARVRTAAARALGASGGPLASKPLLDALDDPDAAVRRASWLALARLALPRSLPALRAAARVERDPEVYRVARRTLSALEDGERYTPATTGSQALELRLQRASGRGTLPQADILLPDGRWLRMQPLPSGELLLPDLSQGPVDVRLHR